ncbi:BA14K family protein [Bartonella raoultii]|uniref:Lectin-like protein BA14k n=1 Tax=Bartonella raoultii TaxID=1457020 RepID=A0ABS7I6E4_9HYPH|nr:BA14K family protein [Bartonella raoultii]MBX4335987.1 BA14K family protein [Bartonella raoultii]
MGMKKKLYYVLVFMFIGSCFIITINIIDLMQNKSDAKAKMVHQNSNQEYSVPLIFTGRKELNGFKGYRHYRRGYHKYKDNWWYPEAAFFTLSHINTKNMPLKVVAGTKKALFTSSLEKKEPWMLKQHIASCRARYRSYNKNDNSFQPFHGPRKQCLSRFFKG